MQELFLSACCKSAQVSYVDIDGACTQKQLWDKPDVHAFDWNGHPRILATASQY